MATAISFHGPAACVPFAQHQITKKPVRKGINTFGTARVVASLSKFVPRINVRVHRAYERTYATPQARPFFTRITPPGERAYDPA
jgi:hypothetical protein